LLRPPRSTPCPYTTLFRSTRSKLSTWQNGAGPARPRLVESDSVLRDATIAVTVCEDKEGPIALSSDQVQAGGLTVTLRGPVRDRSEEHTSELQSRENLVCR